MTTEAKSPTEAMIDAACEAMAFTVAKQDGWTLTPAGYRQGKEARPEDHAQMVEYVTAAVSAALALQEHAAPVAQEAGDVDELIRREFDEWSSSGHWLTTTPRTAFEAGYRSALSNPQAQAGAHPAAPNLRDTKGDGR